MLGCPYGPQILRVGRAHRVLLIPKSHLETAPTVGPMLPAAYRLNAAQPAPDPDSIYTYPHIIYIHLYSKELRLEASTDF